MIRPEVKEMNLHETFLKMGEFYAAGLYEAPERSLFFANRWRCGAIWSRRRCRTTMAKIYIPPDRCR